MKKVPTAGGHNERRKSCKNSPPKSGQFKPGQSGNPKGRPKKPKERSFATELRAAMNEKVMGADGRKHNPISIIVKRTMQDLMGPNALNRKRAMETLDRYMPAALIQEVQQMVMKMVFVKTLPLGPGSNVEYSTDEEEFIKDQGNPNVRYQTEAERRAHLGDAVYEDEYAVRLLDLNFLQARKLFNKAKAAAAEKPDNPSLAQAAADAEAEFRAWGRKWYGASDGRAGKLYADDL